MINFEDDIATPIGPKGSGRIRYAAAMGLFQAGKLSSAALEVYRTCSLLDAQDPTPILAAVNLRTNVPQMVTPAGRVRSLVAAADLYLSTLPGPGIPEVRRGLNQWRAGPVSTFTAPNAVLNTHLPHALQHLAPQFPDLATAIADAAPHLKWITYDGYPVSDIGTSFATGHCYASIIGEDSAIAAKDYDLGLFLIAPHVLYRDHNHAAPELYAPLTGPHGWRFGPDRPLILKPAHEPVWNDPFRPHMTKVGPTPFLALFGWTRDVRAVAKVIPAHDWPELEAMRLDP
jgi:hypothetical protein